MVILNAQAHIVILFSSYELNAASRNQKVGKG